jgi:hypothetical protein
VSELETPINFKQLLALHGRIQIPIIQRDYAQGRPNEEEVREDFLAALEVALRKPAGDPALPLNLDFIYGSTEGTDTTRFLPLDGQQRLTTLFLLHWYLACLDGEMPAFSTLFRIGSKSRFSYAVRTSSNEFFDALVCFEPTDNLKEVPEISTLIMNQPWYFRSWRLDPTIQSVLTMLDAIHTRLSDSQGLFDRLVSNENPSITFQLLDLDNFGLTDDLYIKMNARGKPLTQFETFKARYVRELEGQLSDRSFFLKDKVMTAADYVSLQMDNRWGDLFWNYRDRATNQYDAALMHVFRAIALVSRNPDSNEYLDDVASLRHGYRLAGYAEFHSRKWLDERFTLILINVLDPWSSTGATLCRQLPSTLYFDEFAVFQQLVAPSKPLSFSESVRLSGYALFLENFSSGFDPDEFQAWMRVIFNLSENTDYNRSDDLQRSIRGLWSLLPAAKSILQYLADPQTEIAGFSKQQVDEERLKARLMMADPAWSDILKDGESHGYFRGQIEFLLDWSGVIAKQDIVEISTWSKEEHKRLQKMFSEYFAKAACMFGSSGLSVMPDFLWQRALLTIGNYFLPINRNHSFLIDTASLPDSWKRLLKGDRPHVKQSRQILKVLLDTLDPQIDIAQQLKYMIASVSNLQPWRKALIQTPQALLYCQNSCLRWDTNGEIYLLKKTQMNGMHAELFSFALHASLENQRDRYKPLVVSSYEGVAGAEYTPYFSLISSVNNCRLNILIWHSADFFHTRIVSCPEHCPTNLEVALKDFGYASVEINASVAISQVDILQRIAKLSDALRSSKLE